MTEINWGVVLQIVIAGGIVWLVRGVHNINGSIGKLNVWKEQHEKQDDERHDGVKDQISAVWRKIDG